MTCLPITLPVPGAVPSRLALPPSSTAQAVLDPEHALRRPDAAEIEYASWMLDPGAVEFASWIARLRTAVR